MARKKVKLASGLTVRSGDKVIKVKKTKAGEGD